MSDKKRHLDIITPIKETTAEAAHAVRIDENFLRDVTDGDDHPEFIVVEFEECKSGNNVYYDKEFFVDLAEQINSKKPTGYLGHKHFQGLDKEDLLPDPQVVWLGAHVDTSGVKAKLTAKGYLIPSSEGGKARAWIKRKAINSVSWSADAVLTLGKDGSYRVKEFFLESIDFARKNREGVRNQRLTVVTEMEGGELKVDDDDLKGAVGKLTFQELNAYAPTLVVAIKEMGKDEVKGDVATAVAAKEEELETKHKDEIEKHPEITLMQKIRDLLGIKDDPTAKPDEVLASLLSRLDELGKEAVEVWFNTEILDKKVPENARALVKRLVPVKEMVKTMDVRSERGIEKAKKEVEDRADDILENDDDIKTVIKEMAGRSGGGNFSRNNTKKNEKQNNDDDDEMRDNDNYRVEKVKVG